MLSYQHGYHAGNFADVLKHVALTRILHYLVQKDKPLLYLETHSGRGLYSLQGEQARKTQEYRSGIQLFWDNEGPNNPLFAPYVDLLKEMNPRELKQYPGSPAIALHMLREIDRFYCCELHPQEFQALTQLPTQGKRVLFRQEDGLEQLKILLPPQERRALIFIDPAYELKQEYRLLPGKLQEAYKKFPQGVYCIWYPILPQHYHVELKQRLAKIGAEKTLCAEFYLSKKPQPGMYGCGLWVINPPYTLEGELKVILKQLQLLFNPEGSCYNLEQ